MIVSAVSLSVRRSAPNTLYPFDLVFPQTINRGDKPAAENRPASLHILRLYVETITEMSRFAPHLSSYFHPATDTKPLPVAFSGFVR